MISGSGGDIDVSERAMNRHRAGPTLFIIGFLLGLATPPAAAQSVTVFGAVEEARTCMSGAELAANMRIGSRADVEACDSALMNAKLSRRDRAATYCNRGVIKTAMERHQDAYEDYNKAIELMPDLPEPYVGRGNVLFLADRMDEAIEDYTHAMELELGRMHIALLNRGMAYETQGRLERAETDFRKAVELAPQWPLAQQKLEGILVKRERASPGSARPARDRFLFADVRAYGYRY